MMDCGMKPKKILANSFNHDFSYDEDVGTNIDFNEKWADVFYEPDYVEETGEINFWEDIDINAITEMGDYEEFDSLGFRGLKIMNSFLSKYLVKI